MFPQRFPHRIARACLGWVFLAVLKAAAADPDRVSAGLPTPVAPGPRVISRGAAAGSYQAFPDVCRLANGDLICVFYAGYDHVSLPRPDWPRGGRICAVRSADEGRTWTEPQVLFDGPDDDRDPHIARMRDGTLVCSFFPYRQASGAKPDYETAIVTSRDGGWTWDASPRVLAPGWAVSAPVRELSDGTRLLGVYHEQGDTAFGGVLRSTDQGRTWSAPIAIGQGSGVRLDAETDVIELKDGRILAALRGDKVPLHFARSTDRGLTWSTVVSSGFPGHSPHFTRLKSGEILLAHRLPQTAMHVSRDDGATWSGPHAIDAVIGAYPSTVALNDDSVLVVYYEEGPTSAIRARRFRLADSGPVWLPLEPEVRELGSRRELFVDRFLIDRMEGCALHLHTPQPRETVLRFDRPWEGAFSGYLTVLHDPDDARRPFRMYYRGLPLAGKDGSTNEVTCYAESRDGIAWNKPNLGLFKVAGTRRNNVVLAGQAPYSHNFSPFLDSRPGVPHGERFKAVAGTTESGLHAFASADGIRWKRLGSGPVLTRGAFDSQNVACWSPAERRYLLYLRTWSGGDFAGYRTISRSTSEDFVHWTPPEPMTFSDGPPEHLYTSQTQPYFRAPHLLVSTPMRFVPGRQVLSETQARELGVKPGYAGDAAEAVFMTSRGGQRYDRTFLEAFLRPGLDPGNWASRAGLTALGIVGTAPGELSLYKQAHYAQPSGHLVRHTLRTDGFASIRAPYRGGEWVSHPVRFSGRRLVLNVSTGAAGGVRVELQDLTGKPLPGFGLSDCREVAGDDLEREVRWSGGAEVGALRGRPVRLRFHLKDADLYAFQFPD